MKINKFSRLFHAFSCWLVFFALFSTFFYTFTCLSFDFVCFICRFSIHLLDDDDQIVWIFFFSFFKFSISSRVNLMHIYELFMVFFVHETLLLMAMVKWCIHSFIHSFPISHSIDRFDLWVELRREN